ncbi:MAG: hypothetical protein EOO38_29875, partial [Cytophagaceae bacterium]
MHFSETVFVTTPASLWLNLSFGSRHATYVTGSGSADLEFTYTVQASDTSPDLDALSSSALVLNGIALVKDQAGNNANLTLPTGASSLGGSANLVIDTSAPTAPTAISVTSSSSNPTSFGVNWTNSIDTNLKHHNVMLCTVTDCTTGCLAPVTSAVSPASLTGSASVNYYGCVQGEDQVGQLSAWVASSGVV